jgi:hypothetical protein
MEEEEADQGFEERKEREGRRGKRSEKGKERGGKGGGKGKREQKGGESREEEWEEKDKIGGQKRWREEDDQRSVDMLKPEKGREVESREDHLCTYKQRRNDRRAIPFL